MTHNPLKLELSNEELEYIEKLTCAKSMVSCRTCKVREVCKIVKAHIVSLRGLKTLKRMTAPLKERKIY